MGDPVISVRGLRVSFSNRPALSNLHLEIARGETLALVGASGGGKSTLAALLPRFMSPTQGQILIDGVDAQDYSLVSLRQNMALVTQEVLLFNDTIAANIAYGHANPDQAAVEKAAKAANACQHTVAHGFFSQRFDAFNQRVACVDINACIFVGKWCVHRLRARPSGQ